jgi:aspartyl-tRNA(Asn)/glutamyl-tRNA(Gln) amidotransferase subunit B
MRTKEEANDYRYFPEPDMPPFVPDEQFISEVHSKTVELPFDKKQRYVKELGVPADTADFLVENVLLCQMFDECQKSGLKPKTVANWLAGDMQAQLKRADCSLEESHISSNRLIELMQMVDAGRLPRARAKDVLAQIIETDTDTAKIVADNGWEQVVDESGLEGWVEQAIAANSSAVEQIKDGNLKIFSFLVGQVMRFSQGRADPKKAKEKLEQRLGL